MWSYDITTARIFKIHIRHYDVFFRIWKILIRPYDVTLIYAAYAKCRKIQMVSSREKFTDLGKAKIKKNAKRKDSVSTKIYKSKQSDF